MTTDSMVANVLCKHLGLSGDIPHLIFEQLTGIQAANMGAVHIICNGKENYLSSCQTRPITEDIAFGRIAVECNGQIDSGLTHYNATFHISSSTLSNPANQLPNVLCQQNGFKRADVNVTRMDSETGQIYYTHLSDRLCLGTENMVQRCMKIKSTGRFVPISWAWTVQCYDASECQTGYAIPVIDKEINCLTGRCIDGVCSPYGYEQCQFSCEADYRAYSSTSEFAEWRKTSRCALQPCVPYYEFNIDSHASTFCCAYDYCNELSMQKATVPFAILLGGLSSHDGVFTTQKLDEDQNVPVAILDDPNIPEQFLIHLCKSAGFITNSAARLPSYPKFKEKPKVSQCITDLNYTTCIALVASETPSCGGRFEPCDGRELVINCNAVSPVLRLSDGPTPNIGRLELLLDGVWGTVCSHNFTPAATDVICRSLGFPGGCASHWPQSPFKKTGDMPIHMSDISCHGYEKSIWHCSYTFQAPQQCQSESSDLAIVCQPGSAPVEVFTTPPPYLHTTITELTGREQTTETPTGDVRCYDGECLLDDCLNETVRALLQARDSCTLGQYTFCFIMETSQQVAGSAPSLRFGCIRSCKKGISRLADSAIMYCCNSNLCNLNRDTVTTILQAELNGATTNGLLRLTYFGCVFLILEVIAMT